MSGTLVAGSSNGGPNFAQQGSVDWYLPGFRALVLTLSPSSLGKQCYNFSLEPRAQERIHDAIVKLKKYGSYKDIIWFGFGIKDVITDLADTEEGLTLVALCAALATTYDSTYAAMVIRELCVLCKAPQSLTPAIRQWKTLVDLCSGMFANAHFTLVANGFRQLISGPSNDLLRLLSGPSNDLRRLLPGHSNHLVARHTPTTHAALAEAILMLAKVSKGDILNSTFSGGIDCAWLAAFAEWILLLEVAIYDPNGSLLYRSGGTTDKPPQVTILMPANIFREIRIKSKATPIPSGQILLQKDPTLKDPALRGVNLLNWQGSWSTILHEVFYTNIDDLVFGEVGQYFNMYLYCVSILPVRADAAGLGVARYARTKPNFSNHPVNPLIWTQHDSKGQAFMRFAARRLPEIATCVLTTTRKAYTTFIDDLGLLAIRSIGRACRCAFHAQANQKKLDEEVLLCLETIAETIAIYLWILLDSDIDEDVPPSITGLANLYTWQSRANKSSASASGEFHEAIMNCDFPVLGIDLVLHVLSGLAIHGTPPKHESLPTNDNLARVGNRICVYHCAIEDPNLPPETMFRFRVVRGYISYSGLRFKEICGLKGAYVDDSLKLRELGDEDPIRSVQTIVQETENESGLEMAYLVRYLNKTAQLATHWLHLPYIFRNLQRGLKYLDCAGNCRSLYDEESSPLYDRVHLPMRPRKNDYDRTQQMLSDLRHAGDSWILLSHPGLFEIVTDQPILLYALIDRWSLSLLPFNDCLCCIMRAGQDVHVYRYEDVNIRNGVGRTAKFVISNPFSESVVSLKKSELKDTTITPEAHE